MYQDFKFTRGWLSSLDDLEDCNAHTERLIAIASECQKQADPRTYVNREFRTIRECLEDNLYEHNQRGSLTGDLMTIRHGLRLYLRELIGETFGPEILRKINP